MRIIRMIWMIVLALFLAFAGGCAKKGTAGQAPGHAPNDSSGTAGNPNAGAGTGAGGASGGAASGGAQQQPAGGGAASGGAAGGGTQQPSGGTAAKPPENLPQISRDQYDKITGVMTYDAFTKLVDSPGKLVSENGDKKTYQFQLKDDPKYYVNVVFNKGVFSEKSIFTM
jgi:hypothetical protein